MVSPNFARRPFTSRQARANQKGAVGLVLLIVAAVVGIVIWIASSASVDPREGARLQNSSVYSSLVQQGQAIENGYAQLVGGGTAAADVLLTDVFTNTLTKPQVLPAQALAANETAYNTTVPDMSSGNWNLVEAVESVSGNTYVMAMAGPIGAEMCGTANRTVASSSGTAAGAFAATPTLTYTGSPIPGCVAGTDGKFFFAYPVARL